MQKLWWKIIQNRIELNKKRKRFKGEFSERSFYWKIRRDYWKDFDYGHKCVIKSDGKKYENGVVGFWEKNTFSYVAQPKWDNGIDDEDVVKGEILRFLQMQHSFSAKVRKQSTNTPLLFTDFQTMKCIKQTLIHWWFKKELGTPGTKKFRRERNISSEKWIGRWWYILWTVYGTKKIILSLLINTRY